MIPTSNTPRPLVRAAAALPGVVLAVLAAALLVGGGLLLAATAGRDADGYLSTATHPHAASSYAITADSLDVDLDGASWAVADDAVRVTARSTSDHPVFVGIARTADVGAYLRGVAHERAGDVSGAARRGSATVVPGSARPGLPRRERFWSASAGGTGSQTVTWPVQDGSWSVVVMNADAAPGVRADVRVGAKVPQLTWLAWGALGAGALLLAAAAGLLGLGGRLARRTGRSVAATPRTA